MNSELIKSLIKQEFKNWKISEKMGIALFLAVKLFNATVMHDNTLAVISAICGMLYTVFAGKGKISCYIFGLTGSGFYTYLAFSNSLWGNLALYILYYIPMQILGIFKWKKHLKPVSNEIYKTFLPKKNRIIIGIISILLCFIFAIILYYTKDSYPVLDGVVTALSITGMYLTIKRAIEQWFVWGIVNAISVVIWINITLNGGKTLSTSVMWLGYLLLAVYFYKEWEKEIKSQTSILHK